tara:strand:+ start:394 stop:639 length:246 start_codon:yes stop_codon:yes gene_type:complete
MVKAKSKDWIQKVEKGIEKRGTEDSFSNKAKKAKMTTAAYVTKVLADYKKIKASGKKPTKPQMKLMRQANLAKTFSKMDKK